MLLHNVSSWIVMFVIVSSLKLLLMQSYRSTDFDVHRNWLAVTYQLPLNCWYVDSTSQWTLDYPPLFAYFEALLARVAALLGLHDDLLVLQSAPLQTDSGVLFQRLSVIASDVLLLYGVRRMVLALFGATAAVASSSSSSSSSKSTVTHRKPTIDLVATNALAVGSLVVFNAGLFLVDHIHFQYNGWLLGLLLLACALAAERRYVMSALAFGALIHAKHLFITLGPVVAVFFLRQYVFAAPNDDDDGGDRGADRKSKSWLLLFITALRRLATLVLALAFVACVSFLPFVIAGPCDIGGDATAAAAATFSTTRAAVALKQIMARLFPFGERGLVHAYWAPNAYALYSAADLVLARALGRRAGGALTSGLVELGAQRMQVLPDVSPLHCSLLTLLAMLPVMLRLWRALSRRRRNDVGVALLRAVSHASLCAYWFGWHVHEKAILVALTPLLLVAHTGDAMARSVSLLSAVTGASLVPLLVPGGVGVVCVGAALVAAQHLLAHLTMLRLRSSSSSSMLSTLANGYAFGALVLLPLYGTFVHPLLLDARGRWPFVPLLLTSVYCALAIGVVWVALYVVPYASTR
jgi:alpha-1,3-glucosyltransferase